MTGTSLSYLNQIHKAVLACLVLVSLLAPFSTASNDDWNYSETHTDTREFPIGGMLHVRMSVGDLHIRRGDDDKIRLSYTVKSRSERNLKDVRVDFDVRGNDATIEFHSPYSGNTNFDVEVEIPRNTNLDVHEKVGDLTVENIEGDKDLDLGVGDIRVEREPSTYRLIRASTGIGDVNSDLSGETSGWLGKTLRYHGDGKYELRAHVGVGDITLDGKEDGNKAARRHLLYKHNAAR
jgi:hypothetical protein